MARAKITYVYNPQTGKREWHIHYESPSDATLHEHEAKHRALVREIVGDLDSPDVDVERGDPRQPKGQPAPEEPVPQQAQRKPQ
jgi:hypothetical protein